ncbi:MAG: zinc ribbon domain-containing protein [Planctomycetota bacterium]|nr:zinc ribbon domain-containing protein [Planctomycetota bacterium]
MPTYDYLCGACGHELEVFQSMSASQKRKCPACGKLKLVRQIGAGGGLIFKGSGFYQTDYRSDSYKKGAEADKKATEKKPETSKESKKDSSKSDSPQSKAS